MSEFHNRLDAGALGDRLRVSRMRSGLTQDDVARQIGMSRSTLVAIEKGERKVRSPELRLLSSIYGTSLNSLLREHSIHVDIEPRFRALPETERAKAEPAARLLNDLAAAEVELESVLGRRRQRSHVPERPVGPGDPEPQAEDAATELRHRLGRGMGPIKDLISVLESDLSLRIFIRPIEERSISGLFIYDEEVGGCILLNAYHSAERQLQSAAHETGHFIGNRRRPDVDGIRVDANSRDERFAKRFGFALLMPAAAVRSMFMDFVREHGAFSPRHLVVMAAYFGVSPEAATRRLEDLELLPKGTWDSLKGRGFTGDFARSLLNDRERSAPPTLQQQITPRLWLLAAEAHARDLLTEAQLAELLRLPRIEIRKIIDDLAEGDLGDLRGVEGDD